MTNRFICDIIPRYLRKTQENRISASLAQLDRVTGYEPVGQGFESLTTRQQTAYTEGVRCLLLGKGLEGCVLANSPVGCLPAPAPVRRRASPLRRANKQRTPKVCSVHRRCTLFIFRKGTRRVRVAPAPVRRRASPLRRANKMRTPKVYASCF